MKITRERLEKKGWSDEEIEKALTIIQSAEEKKHPHIKLLDKSIYWIGLLLIIFGNIAFSIFLMPLLVTIEGLSLYIIIILLAGTFGVLMSILIKDIENLEKHHHLALLFVVPIVGLINFGIVVNIANHDKIATLLEVHHNPFIIGLVYLAGFLLPYTYLVFEEKWQKQKK